MDPMVWALKVPYNAPRVLRMRLKVVIPSFPSAMKIFSAILLMYFMVVSGFIYDVIVEPPSIGSIQDLVTGAYKPVVFMSARVNGKYIIEGLSLWFLFMLGSVGIILLDQALDRHHTSSLNLSIAAAGVASVFISYVMSMLFVRIKIPGYLH